MRSKMCRRPRPRPVQGLVTAAAVSSAGRGRVSFAGGGAGDLGRPAGVAEPGAVVEELAAAGGGAEAAGVERGAGGEGGGEERRNAAASVADGGVTLTSPWIDMPGWPRPGHAPTARTAPRTTRAASIVILVTTLNTAITIADHHLSKQSDQARCIRFARSFPRVLRLLVVARV